VKSCIGKCSNKLLFTVAGVGKFFKCFHNVDAEQTFRYLAHQWYLWMQMPLHRSLFRNVWSTNVTTEVLMVCKKTLIKTLVGRSMLLWKAMHWISSGETVEEIEGEHAFAMT